MADVPGALALGGGAGDADVRFTVAVEVTGKDIGDAVAPEVGRLIREGGDDGVARRREVLDIRGATAQRCQRTPPDDGEDE